MVGKSATIHALGVLSYQARRSSCFFSPFQSRVNELYSGFGIYAGPVKNLSSVGINDAKVTTTQVPAIVTYLVPTAELVSAHPNDRCRDIQPAARTEGTVRRPKAFLWLEI